MPSLLDHAARAALRRAGYRSSFVETRVGPVHVQRADGGGPLPPLALLHGFGASGAHLARLAAALRPHVSALILPDAPAHAFSPEPAGGVTTAAVRDGLLEALESSLDRPSLVLGVSMGGFAACQFGLHAPERVAALALVSPGGALEDAAGLRRLADRFRLDDHRAALAFVDDLFVDRPALRPLMALALRRSFARGPMRSLLSALQPRDLVQPEALAGLRPPTLLVWGPEERILPAHHLDFWRRHLPPSARIELPAGFGHSAHYERSAALASLCLDFFRRVTPG
jgi:pimeloyl-ACP methyl ester carboxylesterase